MILLRWNSPAPAGRTSSCRCAGSMASWLETFGGLPEGTSLQVMRDWLRMYRELSTDALIVPFRQVARRPWLATWSIAGAICPGCGLAEIASIAWRFRKAEVKRHADAPARDAAGVFDGGFTYYDAPAFFHRRHVSDLVSRPAEARMAADRLVRIRHELADAIKASGLAA